MGIGFNPLRNNPLYDLTARLDSMREPNEGRGVTTTNLDGKPRKINQVDPQKNSFNLSESLSGAINNLEKLPKRNFAIRFLFKALNLDFRKTGQEAMAESNLKQEIEHIKISLADMKGKIQDTLDSFSSNPETAKKRFDEKIDFFILSLKLDEPQIERLMNSSRTYNVVSKTELNDIDKKLNEIRQLLVKNKT